MTSEELGARIKAQRENLGLSQADVAQEMTQQGIEITPQGFGHYETGRSEPSPTKLLKIAEILRCNVADFYGSNAAAVQPLDLDPVTRRDLNDQTESFREIVRMIVKEEIAPYLAKPGLPNAR